MLARYNSGSGQPLTAASLNPIYRQANQQTADGLPVDVLLRRLDQLENIVKQQGQSLGQSQQVLPQRPESSAASHAPQDSPPQQLQSEGQRLSPRHNDEPCRSPNRDVASVIGVAEQTPPLTITQDTSTDVAPADQQNTDDSAAPSQSHGEPMVHDTNRQSLQSFLTSVSSATNIDAAQEATQLWNDSYLPQQQLGNSQHCIACGRPDTNSRGEHDAPITIPIGHHTSTGSLFALEPVRRWIGDYPRDFFYQIEMCRTSISELNSRHDLSLLLATLDFMGDATDDLIACFFTHIHPNFPILDKSAFIEFFHSTLRGDGREDADAAVCLIVLALGKLSSVDTQEDLAINPSYGLEYFIPAYQILTTQWVSSFGTGLSLPTGLVLASIYMSCLARPLLAWRLVYMASGALQMITPR